MFDISKGGGLMNNLKFLCIWVDDNGKRYIKPHSHIYNELVYFKKGSADTNIGKDSFEVNEGMFTVIENGVFHDEIRHEDTQTICLLFSSEQKINSGRYIDYSGEVLDVLMYMIKEYNLNAYGHNEMLNLKIKEINILIKRFDEQNMVYPSNFQYAINFINNNYKEKIIFTKLAKNLNLSYDYFQHRFKEITGYSPKGYLIKKRLEEAEKLLHINEFNCTEIAYRCGFSNSAQFSMLFKKHYLVAPRDYKRNFR